LSAVLTAIVFQTSFSRSGYPELFESYKFGSADDELLSSSTTTKPEAKDYQYVSKMMHHLNIIQHVPLLLLLFALIANVFFLLFQASFVSLFDDNHVVLNEDGTASNLPQSMIMLQLCQCCRYNLYERQMFILIKVSHSMHHTFTHSARPAYRFPFNSPNPASHLYISILCIPACFTIYIY